MKEILDAIRAKGWSIAIHNDYKQHDRVFTFYLFTKGNRNLKVEGDLNKEVEFLSQTLQDINDLERILQ